MDAANDDAAEVTLATQTGKIFADLTTGADVAGAIPLQAAEEISCPGVKLHGAGFIVTPEEAKQLGLGRIAGLEKHIRDYRNGKDLTQRTRGVFVIDLFGLAEAEVKQRFPEVYQHVHSTVKPERDQNNRAWYRDNWWIHGEPRKNFRPALEGLEHYISTVETAKHRFFVFLDKSILPDNKLVNIALDDAYYLGVLSSNIHVTWALAAGSTLEDRPVYVKTTCFETFPFPACTPAQQAKIRALGEQLDAHRKRQQALHPDLTMTGMYNVMERFRELEGFTTEAQRTQRNADVKPLNAKEKTIYEQGLVGILKQLHDELDAAVAEAYGWQDLYGSEISDPNDEILTRLVALSAERAAEEAKGTVRWLRPEYQNAGAGARGKQEMLDVDLAPAPAPAPGLKAWPDELPAQAAALTEVLASLNAPASVEEDRCALRGQTDEEAPGRDDEAAGDPAGGGAG